jgi:hypothetical protein
VKEVMEKYIEKYYTEEDKGSIRTDRKRQKEDSTEMDPKKSKTFTTLFQIEELTNRLLRLT